MSIPRVGVRTALLLLAVVMAASAAYFVLWTPPPSHRVALPEGSATPEEVVGAFVEALNAHDCETAEALLADRRSEERTLASRWCVGVDALTDVKIGSPRRENPKYSGQSSLIEVVHVPVSFTLDWRPLHDDHSMREGPTTWGYVLKRAGPEEPWRIFDNGPV